MIITTMANIQGALYQVPGTVLSVLDLQHFYKGGTRIVITPIS